MLFMFKKPENLIGLDIGSHAVKLVQISAKNSTVKLLNFGVAPLPKDAFSEGRIKRPDLVASSIQQLAGHLKIKEKGVAASVSGFEVMIKKIDLPMMTEEELDNRMQDELGQYIPYNIDDVGVDYQVLGVAKDRPNFMEVMLVAAKKESISDYVSLIRMSGFEPMIVDVDYFALSNAFESTYGFGEESIALIDIGASKAIMSIIDRGVPVFTRGISIGGAQITEKIGEHFRVSLEEAERMKLGEVISETQIKEVEEIFVSSVRTWVNECKRAIDFFYSNYSDTQIGKVYLSGGSSRMAGLDKVLEEHVEIPVEIFNPLSKIEHDPKLFDPAYVDFVGPQVAISLGLSLRKTKEK